ncbi:MAG: DNA helicase II [Gammaproteobacteria bacterium]|nr:DNA helicase II [Gammaproteobacteria bacterium]
MTHPLLFGLNPPQQQAVESNDKNILVLAGAGSGKTRVLVHRIAWLIQEKQVSPYAILAVTFTNKAAKEMSQRIERILNMPVRGMWVGTFHGLAHRLLRTHWHEIGLPENFQVIDSDDQKRLLKRIMKEMGIDEKEYPVNDVQSFINHSKDNGQRSNNIETLYAVNQKHHQAIYTEYEQICRRSGLVDFAELLLRAHEIWLNHPHLLAHYQQRFRYLLVDEFQDTNTIQYAWINVLSGVNQPEKETADVMVVGDDDQSIYGWRGAKIEHIQQFARDFKPATTIRLEQNYRSTGTILSAANAVIGHNNERLGKTLWTDSGKGESILVYQAYSGYDEADYIVNKITTLIEEGSKREDIAVLYRSNAQSRVIEEKLVQSAIPYRVYGGLRFFDRAEIRDALAYLRLIYARDDDAAFERVINLPARGIGQKTIEKLRLFAKETQQSLWFAAINTLQEKMFSPKVAQSIVDFLHMIDHFSHQLKEIKLHELLEEVYQTTGLKAYYEKEKNEKARSRIENLDELFNAIKQFNDEFPELLNEDLFESEKLESEKLESEKVEDDGLKPAEQIHVLADFLGHAVLESSEKQAEEWDDCVQLMTLHSAKGLEFQYVFLAGMEQGLFPHRMSAELDDKLEEERRLCYVGITRAMKQLYLSFADTRNIHGRMEYCRPSQFIKEIPEQFLTQVRTTYSPAYNKSNSSFSQSNYSQASRQSYSDYGNRSSSIPAKRANKKILEQDEEYYCGKVVQHKKFGEGVITDTEGSGNKLRVQVNFKQAGSRWLLAKVANLD